MPLLYPLKKVLKWYNKDSFMFKNFMFTYKNPLWDKSYKAPKNVMPVCPFFWRSFLYGFLWLRCFRVPITLGLHALRNRYGASVAKAFSPIASPFSSYDRFIRECKWLCCPRGAPKGVGFVWPFVLLCFIALLVILIGAVYILAIGSIAFYSAYIANEIKIVVPFWLIMTGIAVGIGTAVYNHNHHYTPAKDKCNVIVYFYTWAMASIVLLIGTFDGEILIGLMSLLSFIKIAFLLLVEAIAFIFAGIVQFICGTGAFLLMLFGMAVFGFIPIWIGFSVMILLGYVGMRVTDSSVSDNPYTRYLDNPCDPEALYHELGRWFNRSNAIRAQIAGCIPIEKESHIDNSSHFRGLDLVASHVQDEIFNKYIKIPESFKSLTVGQMKQLKSVINNGVNYKGYINSIFGFQTLLSNAKQLDFLDKDDVNDLRDQMETLVSKIAVNEDDFIKNVKETLTPKIINIYYDYINPIIRTAKKRAEKEAKEQARLDKKAAQKAARDKMFLTKKCQATTAFLMGWIEEILGFIGRIFKGIGNVFAKSWEGFLQVLCWLWILIKSGKEHACPTLTFYEGDVSPDEDREDVSGPPKKEAHEKHVFHEDGGCDNSVWKQ